tara:strand:- start:92 stop:529 length:438 start_codon:yes stop_codon:yes gene_type:complete
MTVPIVLVKNVNFGSGQSGLTTVGYRLFDSIGTLSGSRITSGVGEIYTGTGIYSASIHFSTNFSGSILWDTGAASPMYATEEYNPQPEQIEFIKSIEGGRWKLNSTDNTMTFYKDDNSTIIAKFGMSGSSGSPSVSDVFERNRLD